MRTLYYDQNEAQKAITIRHKSNLRIAAYILIFTAGLLAGMAIASVFT